MTTRKGHCQCLWAGKKRVAMTPLLLPVNEEQPRHERRIKSCVNAIERNATVLPANCFLYSNYPSICLDETSLSLYHSHGDPSF